jgi:hypothetical protein
MTSPLGESRGGTPSGERIPKGMRAASDDAEDTDQRLAAFRFFILFVGWVERSETHRKKRWVTPQVQLTHPTSIGERA